LPTVFRHGGYRFFFYSNEGSPQEPVHVHVRSGGYETKIWLEPEIAIAESFGYDARALNSIVRIVMERREEIERAWREHFGD
jgi:hypothetical protein